MMIKIKRHSRGCPGGVVPRVRFCEYTQTRRVKEAFKASDEGKKIFFLSHST